MAYGKSRERWVTDTGVLFKTLQSFGGGGGRCRAQAAWRWLHTRGDAHSVPGEIRRRRSGTDGHFSSQFFGFCLQIIHLICHLPMGRAMSPKDSAVQVVNLSTQPGPDRTKQRSVSCRRP
jgi:hypothetical protein